MKLKQNEIKPLNQTQLLLQLLLYKDLLKGDDPRAV